MSVCRVIDQTMEICDSQARVAGGVAFRAEVWRYEAFVDVVEIYRLGGCEGGCGSRDVKA